MTVSLRLLSPMDAKLLAVLHKEGFDEPWDEKAFATLMETPGVFGVLAGTAKPLGFILCRTAADEAEVLTLFVPESYRRQGVATALLERAAVESGGRGAEALFLEVAEDNAPAIAFYKKRSFTDAGRRPRYYKASIDALILRRDLGK